MAIASFQPIVDLLQRAGWPGRHLLATDAPFRPLLVPILLLSSVPFAFTITEVTSLGNVLLPYLFAFGLLGREMALGRTASIAGRPPKASHAVHTDATGSGAGSANRDQMTQ
jgi:hypothetical protein